MNKTELIKKVAESGDVTQEVAGRVVNAMLEEITSALKEGEKVTLTGFGNFEPRQAAERQGKNPRNPEEVIEIPASKAPVFKAGKGLKDIING
jgi:DNA-binding protein HU-beta